MPILIKPESVLDVGSDRVVDETSDERFDRAAFARRAIDIVRPRRTTIAICEGASRMRVESGRNWGRPRTDPRPPGYSEANVADVANEANEANEAWALLAIPARASRRAIALAVAQLARAPRAYALDVLMGEADGPREAAPVRAPTEPSAG
jgi:hypothetical protein